MICFQAMQSMIFSGPMVRAILEGRKSQTRRVARVSGIATGFTFLTCPYGQPGDRLWVKETWQDGEFAQNEPRGPVYRATDPDWETACIGWKWKPSVYMPRWASRITLEITGVRAERLQDITEDDAVAEGCWGDEHDADQPSPRMCFEAVWTKLYGALGPKSWEANPWVWVVEFQRVEEGK